MENLSQRERNKARIRGAILKAARAKFARVGINDARMDEIADDAGVARATLYNYFPGRSDIVTALVERMADAFIALILRHAEAPGSTAERIVATFAESALILEREADVARLLVGISWQNWGSDGDAAGMERLTAAFVQLLGGENGAADVRKDVDVRLMAGMLISVYSGVAHNWQQSARYPLHQQLAAAARLMAEAITRD